MGNVGSAKRRSAYKRIAGEAVALMREPRCEKNEKSPHFHPSHTIKQLSAELHALSSQISGRSDLRFHDWIRCSGENRIDPCEFIGRESEIGKTRDILLDLLDTAGAN